ncbi:putative metal-binding protein [Candidatus Palauibacter sp.]|uniref:putative metal-binding protein n=1 Tax=Candidatus Palauibacter sp. TaxID=3101350 RepID=UPI003D0BE240
MSEPQFVDPAVSRRKFDREIAEFRSQAAEYGRRGWFLADAEFPHALIVLATAKTQPISMLCGVRFDYSNYDVAPPSVRLVHPLTREPYTWSQLPTPLPRMPPTPNAEEAASQPLPPGVEQALPPEIAQALAQGGAQAAVAVQLQTLMQAHGDDDIPFLCIAGVREYHEHPAHTGDPWESHRTAGAGRLVRLVGIISKYGLETIEGFDVQFHIRFRMVIAPE